MDEAVKKNQTWIPVTEISNVDDTARKRHTWAFSIVGFFALISVTTYAFNEYYIYLSAYLWFGFIYGMCLQYGRFCFASAFRDLFAVGVPRMVVGIMISVNPFCPGLCICNRHRDKHLSLLSGQYPFSHCGIHIRCRDGLCRRLRVGLALQDRGR